MDTLRTGIIGLGGDGITLLSQLFDNENYSVQALADTDKELAQEYALQHDARPYDDYRLLIVQEKLDVLFLMVPTYQCGECIPLAAKAGLHVFKQSPLARTLPEACQWLEILEKADLNFHIGGPGRFAPGYLLAHKKLQEQQIGRVYLIQAEGFWNYPEDMGWRGDPVLAGGGVLIDKGYHLVDQILWNLTLPESLYSTNSNFCQKQTLPPYRTEDTVALSMNFPDGAMGHLLCGWTNGPASEKLIMYGTAGRMRATADSLQIYDVEGKKVFDETFEVDHPWLIAQQARHFADSLFDPEIKPISTAREHLANVAVIESAYLSARTRQPEPVKLYGSVFEIQ